MPIPTPSPTLAFVLNPDLVATTGDEVGSDDCVGFAETNEAAEGVDVELLVVTTAKVELEDAEVVMVVEVEVSVILNVLLPSSGYVSPGL